MNDDPRQHSPAAERNRSAILAELQRLLPECGVALEIASGTGQHAAYFSAGLPGWQWLPSDPEPDALASIKAWCEGSTNVLAPIKLNVMSPTWPGAAESADAVFCANMLHIAPWVACAALMRGAARHLAPNGRLLLYGPYLVDGEPVTPSNTAFDAELRERNPAWGLRRLADVLAQAKVVGLHLRERVEMPSNNLLLVLERAV